MGRGAGSACVKKRGRPGRRGEGAGRACELGDAGCVRPQWRQLLALRAETDSAPSARRPPNAHALLVMIARVVARAGPGAAPARGERRVGSVRVSRRAGRRGARREQAPAGSAARLARPLPHCTQASGAAGGSSRKQFCLPRSRVASALCFACAGSQRAGRPCGGFQAAWLRAGAAPSPLCRARGQPSTPGRGCSRRRRPRSSGAAWFEWQ